MPPCPAASRPAGLAFCTSSRRLLFEVNYILAVFYFYSQRRVHPPHTYYALLLRPGWDLFGSSPELK